MSDIALDPEAVISDIEFAEVRRWKDAHPGGKAIAYFPVYAPVEIIHAAGALPVGLHGAGDRLDLQHADARFGSFICSIAKTTLELGMTERLKLFDGMLFSGICDTARNLCWVLKRNFPDIYTDFLHLPQNPQTTASAEFLASEYRRMIVDLEAMTGNKVTDDALRQSIALFNRNRALTAQLFAMRTASPHLLPTAELYTTVRVGNFIPVEMHNALLEEKIAEVPQRTAKSRDSIRIVIEGSFCEQPPIDLIRIIEHAGCYVVDDDLTLGRRWFAADIESGKDPVESLADAYMNHSVYSSVRHDFRKPRFKELVKKVRSVRADAVLLLVAKFCEPAYFDYVLFKRELESEGIPHLNLEFEEKMFTFERLQTELETFVESLLFA
jgi:Benzoyl-CoA reductase/2-hydroxyglutaryl-CoA dehydratase subunit, BcrC/BadD/HgdB